MYNNKMQGAEEVEDHRESGEKKEFSAEITVT
jgi:hypothetical protein